MLLEYFKSELIVTSRKKLYLVLSILLPCVFYLLFTTILDTPKSYETKFYKEYMYSMAVFSMSSFCIMTFPLEMIEDKEIGWNKSLFRTPFTPFYYYMSKVIKMMCLFLISISVLFVVGNLYNGVHMSLMEWLGSGVLLWVGATLFLSIGILISQISDLQTASAIANIVYLSLAILGGLWFPTEAFPTWLQQISYLTPTYNLKELALSFTTTGHVAFNSLFILIFYSILFMSSALMIHKKVEVV
ncbi:ABC transporter permease [Staphylococcus sp. 17KM0847]|uniref:ABC transporter permease n=1 Tax=Staphylococcus sp. 17KM0847 TaxID=2583989 RepID=UPI0015DCD5C8|nr:ABC transporter permease [Staphylococcus sp. 17KM0847]QLK86412.1 ABC transporter permease [Staphylococcus sp. 17KM0847]